MKEENLDAIARTSTDMNLVKDIHLLKLLNTKVSQN
jgi:hypothetical protein